MFCGFSMLIKKEEEGVPTLPLFASTPGRLTLEMKWTMGGSSG